MQDIKLMQIMTYSPEDQSINQFLVDWTVTSVSQKEIALKLTFSEPAKVSRGIEKDHLHVTLFFNAFEGSDGSNMPEFYHLSGLIPRQVTSEDDVLILEDVS